MTSPASQPPLPRTTAITLALVFAALLVMNTGGYRYGVSDQAFYIPVVLHELRPELFPHDRPLIAAQDRFLLFDDWIAPALRVTGLPVETAFLVGFGGTVLLLYGAIVGLGRSVSAHRWTVAGLVIGLTMRHRIPDTGANSVEGYFHPRVLGFAVGLWAVVVFLRGRTWPALALSALALLIHPTTALWFSVLLGSAALVADREERPRLAALAGLAGVAALAALAGPLRGGLVVMDEAWWSLLSTKDYLDSTGWPLSTWAANLGLGVVIGGIHLRRRQLGLSGPREAGLVVGCGVLILVFLLSVPLAASGVALVVQMQVNRIFWLLDIIATAFMAWLLVESPAPRLHGGWARPPRSVVVIVVAVLALARGVFVSVIDPTGRPIEGPQATPAEWAVVMTWAGEQPVGTHFLADPAHALLYGPSVRVASGRDVYLEEVKDVAISMYSREIAARVATRIDDLGPFVELTADDARRLAARYALDYLIAEHDVDLPVVLRSGSLRVYELP